MDQFESQVKSLEETMKAAPVGESNEAAQTDEATKKEAMCSVCKDMKTEFDKIVQQKEEIFRHLECTDDLQKQGTHDILHGTLIW